MVATAEMIPGTVSAFTGDCVGADQLRWFPRALIQTYIQGGPWPAIGSK